MYISTKISGDIHLLHISVHENELGSKLVFMLSGPQDNLNNLVYYISVNHEAKAKAKNGIICLNRVHGSNITI